MSDEKKMLSDSEIQKLRDDLAETEKRRWLYKLVRTGAAWIVGLIAAAGTIFDTMERLVDVVTRK